MTESEEVAWINSLGFSTDLTKLRASYASFTPYTVPPPGWTVNGTSESDDLRNYYRLALRTGHPGFQTQAQRWRDFYVSTYSHPENGGGLVIEPRHIYLMGLIDWYQNHTGEADTLAAIHRIVDFILAQVSGKLVETRIHARAIQCLAYYVAKMGPNAHRLSEVRTRLDELINAINTAPTVNGFTAVPKIFDSNCYGVDGLPPSVDLRSRFPGNLNQGLVCSATTYKRGGGTPGTFPGVAGNQDPILIHALNLSSRVLGRPALATKAKTIATAWLTVTGFPFWSDGSTENLAVGYLVITNADDISMYTQRNGGSTPLYTTQHAPFCPDVNMRRRLAQQALLRQYGEYTKITEAQVTGVEPRYYPWATWEQGYFLTQK